MRITKQTRLISANYMISKNKIKIQMNFSWINMKIYKVRSTKLTSLNIHNCLRNQLKSRQSRLNPIRLKISQKKYIWTQNMITQIEAQTMEMLKTKELAISDRCSRMHISNKISKLKKMTFMLICKQIMTRCKKSFLMDS